MEKGKKCSVEKFMSLKFLSNSSRIAQRDKAYGKRLKN